uniref:Reverse transcriptase domain-containing protein n=1 Tax=Ascaris lumbricoides TaxID=6252 RepID=A0A0M3IB03_ASCLU
LQQPFSVVRTHLDESLNNGLAYLDSSNGTNAADRLTLRLSDLRFLFHSDILKVYTNEYSIHDLSALTQCGYTKPHLHSSKSTAYIPNLFPIFRELYVLYLLSVAIGNEAVVIFS